MSEQPLATRREVTLAGRFVGLSIIGTAVILIIFLEKFGSPDWIPMVKYFLAASFALGIAVPLIFFRRPVPLPVSRE